MVMEKLSDAMKPILEKFKENGLIPKKETPEEHEKRQKEEYLEALESLRNGEKTMVYDSSLVSDWDDLKSHFDDFKVKTPKQAEYLKQARRIANEIYAGSTQNYVFTGKAGTGKTMLAVCILNGINETTSDKTCLFVSAAMFIDLEREASLSSSQFVKDRAYRIERRIKECDLLVLDDLGSESILQAKSNTNNQPVSSASDFIQRKMFLIADYRKNKANIVTTNNSSRELNRIYNEKICSRLLTKNLKSVVQFSSEDMRN